MLVELNDKNQCFKLVFFFSLFVLRLLFSKIIPSGSLPLKCVVLLINTDCGWRPDKLFCRSLKKKKKNIISTNK